MQQVSVLVAAGNFDDNFDVARMAEPGKLILRYIGTGAAGIGSVIVSAIVVFAARRGAMAAGCGGGADD